MIDDFDAGVIVWQEEEVGEHHPRRRRHWRRPQPGGSVTTPTTTMPTATRRSSRAAARPIPRTRSTRPTSVARHLHRRVQRPAQRRDAVAHRVHRPGPRVRPLHRHERGRRVPEQRSAVPPRHAHAHVRDASSSAARTCSLRRVDGDELCRIIDAERCTGAFLVGPIFEQMLEVNARRTATTCRACAPRVGRPEWDAMTSRDPSRVGRRARAATARPR